MQTVSVKVCANTFFTVIFLLSENSYYYVICRPIFRGSIRIQPAPSFDTYARKGDVNKKTVATIRKGEL